MSSRKALREEARAQRVAKEQELAAQAQRRRRLRMLGTALGAAVVAVVIAIAVSSSGGGKSAAASSASAVTALGTGQLPPYSAVVNQAFTGIPEHGVVLGNPSAPVTMTEFIDLRCPACRNYEIAVFPQLLDKYVKTGKLRIVAQLQTFVGDQFAPGDGVRAARMGLAVAQQNRFWPFAELFYLNQGDETTSYANDAYVSKIAEGVRGVDVPKALAARSDPTITQQLAQMSNAFNNDGFNATPSFLIGRTGGTTQVLNPTAFTLSQFSGPIDRLLRG